MECSIKRILQFKDAIQYSQFQIFALDGKDITNNCLYSWSTDGICWVNWVDYNKYIILSKNIQSDFYCRILLFDSFDKILINGKISTCYTICFDTENSFIQNFCESPNLFQPYNNLDCALLLQEQLSDSIVCMFGIPIYYFKTEPNQKSADYTFKEYFLKNVVDIKQLKLMIPDGQMPSSNPKLTELDFDWETDWETELSKTQFAKAFGDTAFPATDDFIYIPMMKRMWQVNAAYDEKNEGLMWRSSTWKLSLVKYSDSTNINTDEYLPLIDKWVFQTYENTFHELEKNEQERQTGYSQLDSPKFAATNLYDIFMEDMTRKQFTKNDTTILEKTYCHRNNIVARNLYKFHNSNGCITYQKGICGEDGVITFILETSGTMGNDIQKDILNFGEININLSYEKSNNIFNIECNNLSQNIEPFSTYMIIYKWNRQTFTTELNIYKYSHDNNLPSYKLRPEDYYFDFEHPVCELVGSYNNDYMSDNPLPCQIHAYPAQLTNIKYYNKYLSKEESFKECIKYTTTNSSCVINDLARPINSGHGYLVR